MEEYIGFSGTGCTIEFELVTETRKAYFVRLEDGVELWLPKSGFDETGSLTEYGVKVFHQNYSEAIGE